jgi:hypothetical protein
VLDRRASDVEECRQELGRAVRPRQFQDDWSAIGLDGDRESQESAAVPFGFHGHRECLECVRCGLESNAQSIGQHIYVFGSADEIGEKPFASRAQGVRT